MGRRARVGLVVEGLCIEAMFSFVCDGRIRVGVAALQKIEIRCVIGSGGVCICI